VVCDAAHAGVHDAIVKAIAPLLYRAGLSGVSASRAACEVAPGLFGDIIAVGRGSQYAQRLVVDVTIVSPQDGDPGAAAAAAEKRKYTHYGRAVGNDERGARPGGDQHWYLFPFAVETHGRQAGVGGTQLYA